ncbi:MAG: hypothetical protein ACLFQV_04415 [Vulcanimicrobiota bacterium]
MGKIIAYIVSVLLITGSIYLISMELKNYPRLKDFGYPARQLNIRMARRFFGVFILMVVAGMILWGIWFLPDPSKKLYMMQVKYWAVVFALVVVMVGLAFWDVVDGVNTFARHMEKNALTSLQEIKCWENSIEDRTG